MRQGRCPQTYTTKESFKIINILYLKKNILVVRLYIDNDDEKKVK